MMKFAVVVLLSVLLPATVTAQRQCKKGIPCGNSCIAATKVCRIGTEPARDSSAPAVQSLFGQAVQQDETWPWVAGVDGLVFYRSACAVAQRLHPDERQYFANVDDAMRAGFRRSRAKGC